MQGCCMARVARVAPGRVIFHVMNRGNLRAPLFHSDVGYRSFLDILGRVQQHFRMRILAYCLMPNHWHLLLWPHEDGELGRFMQRVTSRHTQVVHGVAKTAGQGHLYQSRYRSFPVSTDAYLLAVCRYIERNPVEANLVTDAADWPWSSFAERAAPELCRRNGIALEPLPIDCPADWAGFVSQRGIAAVQKQWKASVAHGIPFGSAAWVRATASALNLPAELSPGGRPRKVREPSGR